MHLQIKDQCGRQVELASRPQRIISLVPSQTELLFDLGLEEHVVGITRYCVHPESGLNEKRVVGGTKKIVEKRVMELQPDLIICNKEENTPEIVAFCERMAPTYVSDISTLPDAYQMISQLGELTGTTTKAIELIAKITGRFATLELPARRKKALYLIWKNPYMTVGGDTFINAMMDKLGLDNLMAGERRYPQLSTTQILAMQPEVILFSSEPYNFKEADLQELRKEFDDFGLDQDDEKSAFAKAIKPPICLLVNGEFFSWYGSRLLQTPAYFRELQSVMA